MPSILKLVGIASCLTCGGTPQADSGRLILALTGRKVPAVISLSAPPLSFPPSKHACLADRATHRRQQATSRSYA